MRALCLCLAVMFTANVALAAKPKKSAAKPKAEKPPKGGSKTKQPPKPEPSDVDQAIALFAEARWQEALDHLELLLAAIDPAAAPTPKEQTIREHQVLSLYELKRESDAASAFKQLVERFPDFAFDEDRVLPKTIGFFATHDPRMKVAPAPVVPVVSPEPTTDVVLSNTPPWSPAYLIPLGIGQFIARSPVRGVLFMVLQAGLIAMNVIGYVMFNNQLVPAGMAGGGGNVARDLPQAQMAQIIMNVGFIGWISALALGTLDGLFLESMPPGVAARR